MKYTEADLDKFHRKDMRWLIDDVCRVYEAQDKFDFTKGELDMLYSVICVQYKFLKGHTGRRHYPTRGVTKKQQTILSDILMRKCNTYLATLLNTPEH